MIPTSSQGQQEGAAIIPLIIIDVTSAMFLSSVILDAIQKTPAEILARNPCACQGRVIGVALEQREGQPLGSLQAVILMKVRILYQVTFNTDLTWGGISTFCIVTFKIAFYQRWKKNGDFIGNLELEDGQGREIWVLQNREKL